MSQNGQVYLFTYFDTQHSKSPLTSRHFGCYRCSFLFQIPDFPGRWVT